MKPWQQIGATEVVYDGWRKVFRKVFLTNDSKEFIAELFDSEGSAAAAVIALTPENKVVVARQFRVGPNKVMEELPGGMVDHGEDPEEAARRELREETGYAPARMTKLGVVHKNAYMQSTYYFFLAEDCVKVEGGQSLDDEEEIEVHEVTIGTLFANAKNSLMTDTEALFFAYEILKEREGKSEATN